MNPTIYRKGPAGTGELLYVGKDRDLCDFVIWRCLEKDHRKRVRLIVPEFDMAGVTCWESPNDAQRVLDRYAAGDGWEPTELPLESCEWQ